MSRIFALLGFVIGLRSGNVARGPSVRGANCGTNFPASPLGVAGGILRGTAPPVIVLPTE